MKRIRRIDLHFRNNLTQLLGKYEEPLNIIFIGITGSYGRGEADLEYNGVQYSVLNDLDFLVVSDRLLTEPEKLKIYESIRKIYKGWLDIEFLTPNSKRFNRSSIWLYDIKVSSITILGNFKNVKLADKCFDLRIPKREALILWKTRMWTFWSQDYYGHNNLKAHYQIAKLIFAIVDIYSLPDKYESTYSGKSRVRGASELFDHDLLQQALNVKNGIDTKFSEEIDVRGLINIMLAQIGQLYLTYKSKIAGLIVVIFHPYIWKMILGEMIRNKSFLPLWLFLLQYSSIFSWVFMNLRANKLNKYVALKSLECQKKS